MKGLTLQMKAIASRQIISEPFYRVDRKRKNDSGKKIIGPCQRYLQSLGKEIK